MICGWLDREGQLITCEPFTHIQAADKIIKERKIQPFYDALYGCQAEGERLLEVLGYIKISDNHVIFTDYEHGITSKQVLWLQGNLADMTPKQQIEANLLLML